MSKEAVKQWILHFQIFSILMCALMEDSFGKGKVTGVSTGDCLNSYIES